jgi:NAD(P)-dependent dehydrogenase (short-subunit alcohol dehydrogenase family)
MMVKTWLITGSARGLGLSITEAALNAGHNVVATARDVSKLKALETRYGDQIGLFALDVTKAAEAEAAAAFTMQKFGRIDVVVNNAGYGHIEPFELVSPESFKDQIDTNFYGVVNLTRAVLATMRQQRAGVVINISSVGGRVGTPGLSAYQSAKWAVGGFTEVLSQECASFGVKFISIEPGGMRTDWGHTAGGAISSVPADYEPSVGAMLGMLKAYAGHEIGDPAKIAKVILDVSARDKLPAHLVLGSDAKHVFTQAEAVRQAEAAAWDEVTTSTNYDGADLSFFASRTE